MQIVRRTVLWIFIVGFAMLSLPAFAQQVIATIPVGVGPALAGVNPVTNKIYVPNTCGNDPSCQTYNGTVSVIDGISNTVIGTISTGSAPHRAAVNPATNKIYVPNSCGNDGTCTTHSGTVTVIDGVSNTVVATVNVGNGPYEVAVNSVTNRIYVTNTCGSSSCSTFGAAVSVIDGVSNTVIATVNTDYYPSAPVVDSVTNKIYVANQCGNDPSCGSPHAAGTVTVIDGATNNPTTVNVGIWPDGLDVNSTTNKIYVANHCGDDPSCVSTATMTVIDGTTLATTEVPIGGLHPRSLGVNPITNKIYISSTCNGDASCQGDPNGTLSVVDGATLTYSSVAVGELPNTLVVDSAANQIYVANRCGNDQFCLTYSGTVTVINGATLGFNNINVGSSPYQLALNSVTNRIYVTNYCGNDPSCNTSNGTVSVIGTTPPAALQFLPLAPPCRAVDTRPGNGGGGPIQSGTHQDFAISNSGTCGTIAAAAAYSMNVSVVPNGPLGYLTVWPAGQPRPLASTLNSLDGRIKANAAIIPAGANGKISVFATNTTNVIVDVNGYFTPISPYTLAFYPLPPCRIADTRKSSFPQGLGPPFLTGGTEREFPIRNATACNIPTGVAAYSLNFSVVPHGSLFYMTVWPSGEPRPTVSTLNDIPGTVIANAAIVVAGISGDVSVYPTNDTDLVIDVNGYFAPPGTGGLSLYGVQPCRVIDTRNAGGAFTGTLSPPVDVVDAGCGASSTAQAYVFNASVVPVGALGYLTLWPDGASQPLVSTLNALDASISSNMAIVPSTNGKVDAYASGITQLILDISSYFAP